MTYTQQITEAVAVAVKLAQKEKYAEDAAYVHRKKIRDLAKSQVEEAAKKHAETAVFDGRKFTEYNPTIALEWAHFLTESASIKLRDAYDSAFFSYAPTIHECHKCEKSYTGKSCPTCENRRFEADHSNL